MKGYHIVIGGYSTIVYAQAQMVEVKGDFRKWYSRHSHSLTSTAPIAMENAELLSIDANRSIWGLGPDSEMVVKNRQNIPQDGLHFGHLARVAQPFSSSQWVAG